VQEQLESEPADPAPSSSQAPPSEQNGQKRVSPPESPELTPPSKRQKVETKENEDSPAPKPIAKATKPAPKAKTKKSAPAAKPKSKAKPKPKKRKVESSEDEDDFSEEEEEEEEEDEDFSAAASDSTPKKPAVSRGRKATSGRKSYKEESESDTEGDVADDKPALEEVVAASTDVAPVRKETKPAGASAPKQVKSEEEDSPLSELAETSELELAMPAAARDDDDSSDLSSLIDESPKPKRKAKTKIEPKTKSKSAKTKSGSTHNTAEPSPDEAEIKRLQSQLNKCGIRKIWGIELKKYGDDARSKIKHLKQMLSDAGMEGRFSEQKAQAIKERRELMADLEAVNEMNDLWGMEGRASRSRGVGGKKKSYKESDDEDEEDGEDNDGRKDNVKDNGVDDEDEDEEAPRVHARAKPRADLDFLGDESESD
jgi:hypothetical protein